MSDRGMEVDYGNSGSKTRHSDRSPGPRMRAWSTEATARRARDQRIPEVQEVSSPSVEEVSSSESPAVDAPAREVMPNGGPPDDERRAHGHGHTTELEDD